MRSQSGCSYGGCRRDSTPPKWSISLRFWSPTCRHVILFSAKICFIRFRVCHLVGMFSFCVLFAALLCTQVMGSSSSSYNIPWPDFMQSLLDKMRLALLDVYQVTAVDCIATCVIVCVSSACCCVGAFFIRDAKTICLVESKHIRTRTGGQPN